MVRVAALPPPPPRGDSLKMKFAYDSPTPAKSAAMAPELDVFVEYAAPPGITAMGQANSPSITVPPETAPPRGLSSDTVSTPSAPHEHIELSQEVIAPTSSTMGESIDMAQKSAADPTTVLPRSASLGENMEAHTLAPPNSEATTQARFSGWVYESRRRFRSAPAPSRLEAKMELARQVGQFMGVVHAEGASSSHP